jgi:hypothetical protein
MLFGVNLSGCQRQSFSKQEMLRHWQTYSIVQMSRGKPTLRIIIKKLADALD